MEDNGVVEGLFNDEVVNVTIIKTCS